ncbi:hypothetical protein FG386_001789 [Cryptosporidium ryanae]|uniref:uncharacterized protein n=1 Tax=Cryptosporidium ryanae TaxID=515981 RepID=UPI00351A5147|nr:hypothetical protein FG386_001789 [Cryptosporidium ryanae]
MDKSPLSICDKDDSETHDSLTFIDSISEEERLMVDELIKDEIRSAHSINGSGVFDKHCASSINEYVFAEEKVQFSNKSSKLEPEKINSRDDALNSLKSIGKEIQYNNIYMSNLQLLKENGEILWDKERESLVMHKRILDSKRKKLEKKLKQKEAERKEKQVSFYVNHLSPLLQDINRLKRNNNELIKSISLSKKL